MKHNYKINRQGCSESPLLEILYNKGKCIAKIKYAEKDGLWAYGYSFSMATHYGGSGACFCERRKQYPNKEAARKVAIKEAIKFFSAYPEECKNVLLALKKLEAPQLSLF